MARNDNNIINKVGFLENYLPIYNFIIFLKFPMFQNLMLAKEPDLSWLLAPLLITLAISALPNKNYHHNVEDYS